MEEAGGLELLVERVAGCTSEPNRPDNSVLPSSLASKTTNIVTFDSVFSS